MATTLPMNNLAGYPEPELDRFRAGNRAEYLRILRGMARGGIPLKGRYRALTASVRSR
jgi:hypothetical protein